MDVRTEDAKKPTNRQLATMYMAAIIGDVMQAWPEECNIDLKRYVGAAPLPTTMGIPEDEKTFRRLYPEDAAQIDADLASDKQRLDDYEERLRIARGTLRTALEVDLIKSPNQQEFISTQTLFYLANCTLAKEAVLSLTKEDEGIDAMLKEMSKQFPVGIIAGDGKLTFLKSIAKYVAEKSGEYLKEQDIDDLIEKCGDAVELVIKYGAPLGMAALKFFNG